MMLRRLELVLILVAAPGFGLRCLLPTDNPLAKEELTVPLAQTIGKAFASKSKLTFQINAEILRAVQIAFSLCPDW